MSNQETLENAFRTTLLLDDDIDLPRVAYGKTEEWDSVAHMQLVGAIESAFNVMLDTDEVIAMSDFAIARDLLKANHGIEFAS
jgi:acyl carrier protein